ncbi:putative Kinase interacting family protein [Tripterygium wilfordii]|uniref:Putative Kinase interacting family protein n=1 Tax=Tripterygium wilfordii TaxID=458696 RepID=A0A7J7CII9_TRIWF|nr:protein EMBRYO DEFECTIVE 1674-like [Tripterygium wilfordii]KAF5733870.1 putative Kinase interacting family protein [Tripterygium wilfordii]
MVSTRSGKSLPPPEQTPPLPQRPPSFVASTPTGPKSQADPNPDAQFLKSPPTAVSALSIKSVFLYDWWLMKPKGNKNRGLAVGGFASRGRQEARVFCSAEISKRHDTTTLETMDGITVTISGFINRSRTHSNGFPLEICHNFMLGFPYNWEEYATQPSSEEAVDRSCPSAESGSSANSWCTLLPAAFDDLPVTKARDFLMSPLQECERRTLFNHILGKLGSIVSGCAEISLTSNPESVSHVNTANFVQNETPQAHNRSKTTQKCRDEDGTLYETPLTRNKAKATQKCRDEADILDATPRRIVTRSMTRLMKKKS